MATNNGGATGTTNETQQGGDTGGGTTGGEVDRSADAGGTDDAGELSAEERAAFDAMRADPAAADAPTGDAAGADGAGDQGGAGGAADQGAGKRPAAAAAGTADPAADGDDDDDEAPLANGEKPPRRVSGKKYAALEAKAQKLEQDANARAIREARLEERMNLLNEALTAPQQQVQEKKEDDDPEPDPEKDIFGHNAWLSRQLKKEREARVAAETGTQQRQQAATDDASITSQYQAAAVAFAGEEPGFVDAYNYMLGTRIAELAEYYFGKDLYTPGTALTPQELAQIKPIVLGEEKRIVSNAIKQRRDPARSIFNMAKARGWKPQPAAAAAADGKQVAKTGENGAAKPAANGAANGNGQQKQPNVLEEIDRINKGQEAALSLSNGNGSPTSALSIERVLAMDDDEFGAVIDGLSSKALQRMAGG